MPVIVLLRHGTSSANTAGILAGRAPGVSLTAAGRASLQASLDLLPHRNFDRLLHSPLDRCVQTAQLATGTIGAQTVSPEPRLIELDYGDWTGRKLSELGDEPLWKDVLAHASRVRFPGGESIAEAAARARTCVHDVVAELAAAEKATAGNTATEEKTAEARQTSRRWAMLVSHGDIIKAIIADALGMPLDDFQRLSVAPGSFTIIDYSGPHPVLAAMSVTAAGMAETAQPGGGGLVEED